MVSWGQVCAAEVTLPSAPVPVVLPPPLLPLAVLPAVLLLPVVLSPAIALPAMRSHVEALSAEAWTWPLVLRLAELPYEFGLLPQPAARVSCFAAQTR